MKSENCDPRSQICDSRFFGNAFSTAEGRRIFCDYHRLQRWLDVEVALLRSQAELLIIPSWAAETLEKCASLSSLNLEMIRTEITRTGHSLLPLLAAWQKAAGNEAGQYINYGATTQDIQDTAQTLELREMFWVVERDLALIKGHLATLAATYRDLVIIGRTHGQQALPTTLGLKFAICLDELLRNGERLRQGRERILVSQLFGGVGTMAALGDKAFALAERFAASLGLNAPLTPWHGARDRPAEFLTIMSLLSGGLAKIANEIFQLSRNEIGELEEIFHPGKVGSSTMPHKRNPELCEQVVVLAKLIRSEAGLGLETLICEHERDYRAVRLEWSALSNGSLFFCALLELMKVILSGLIVHKNRIEKNVRDSAVMISTEALMFVLGKKIGKQNAHHLIYEAAMTAHVSGNSLLDLLLEKNEVKSHFSRNALEQAIQPADNIGCAGELVDRILSLAVAGLDVSEERTSDEIKCPLGNHEGGCRVIG